MKTMALVEAWVDRTVACGFTSDRLNPLPVLAKSDSDRIS